jgi:hypothetical protein
MGKKYICLLKWFRFSLGKNYFSPAYSVLIFKNSHFSSDSILSSSLDLDSMASQSQLLSGNLKLALHQTDTKQWREKSTLSKIIR